jgi:hypothetical protein
MHKALFADIEEASSGATVPIVGEAPADIFLEAIEMCKREQRRLEPTEAFIHALLLGRERFQLSSVIMQDPDGAGEAQFRFGSPNNTRTIDTSVNKITTALILKVRRSESPRK